MSLELRPGLSLRLERRARNAVAKEAARRIRAGATEVRATQIEPVDGEALRIAVTSNGVERGEIVIGSRK